MKQSRYGQPTVVLLLPRSEVESSCDPPPSLKNLESSDLCALRQMGMPDETKGALENPTESGTGSDRVYRCVGPARERPQISRRRNSRCGKASVVFCVEERRRGAVDPQMKVDLHRPIGEGEGGDGSARFWSAAALWRFRTR